jgi:PmbA protein
MERDYDFTSAVYFEDLRPADVIGKEAGERAVRRSNPQKVKTGKYLVIIDRRVAGGMLGNMLGAANAAAVARKTSFWRKKLGDQVAAKSITVHDNPLLDRGFGSRPFDGEGLGVAPLVIIEEGVLKTWLLDSATARELSLETNARAARSGAGTSPSSTNAWLDPGERSIEEMAREIGTGFYVTETIGHGVNMVTGDYSKGASGFWIEGGEITYPVSEITIAGNLIDMFKAMHPLRDLEFRGSVNSPSLLIDGMTIGGN